jgi:hypothetical protein
MHSRLHGESVSFKYSRCGKHRLQHKNKKELIVTWTHSNAFVVDTIHIALSAKTQPIQMDFARDHVVFSLVCQGFSDRFSDLDHEGA